MKEKILALLLLTQAIALRRSADFMRTVTDADADLQRFWQAFPAEGGSARTTYMFSYADCAKQRPSLQVGWRR